METVTISKKEYEKLKKKTEVDWELVNHLKRSFKDIKNGRIREWKGK
ncbi:MAG TPA: hypothetical protein VJG30_02285 [Candidatus Nanoarchaeia archaeon]|nr:hypothetical protein [Candidatus Nanoarchaeia archaeon]